MRNGNGGGGNVLCVLFVSSYPTYEEWKLFFAPLQLIVLASSYPTYEEWKPDPELFQPPRE